MTLESHHGGTGVSPRWHSYETAPIRLDDDFLGFYHRQKVKKARKETLFSDFIVTFAARERNFGVQTRFYTHKNITGL